MEVLTAPFLLVVSRPIAILACAVASFVIGGVWYGLLFKKPWGKLSGMDKVPKAKMKKQMLPAIVVSVVSSIVQASVIGMAVEPFSTPGFLNNEFVVQIFSILVVVWFTFTVSVLATSYAYTMKSVKLLLIDTLYPLLTWIAMTAILLTVRF